MTEYLVMIPADEAAWAAATPEEREFTFGKHREFWELLEERGHKVANGSELAPSSTAKTLRSSADGTTTITDGPFAETVEQLSGFYIVESDDLDGLLEVCKVLMQGERVIEVRRIGGGH